MNDYTLVTVVLLFYLLFTCYVLPSSVSCPSERPCRVGLLCSSIWWIKANSTGDGDAGLGPPPVGGLLKLSDFSLAAKIKHVWLYSQTCNGHLWNGQKLTFQERWHFIPGSKYMKSTIRVLQEVTFKLRGPLKKGDCYIRFDCMYIYLYLFYSTVSHRRFISSCVKNNWIL